MITLLLVLAIWLLLSLIIVFPLAEMMHIGSGGDSDEPDNVSQRAKGTQPDANHTPTAEFPTMTDSRASHFTRL
jgi:hypothetical protein